MNFARRIWLECFVVILILLNGVLLLPGSQSVRFPIRAAPYLASLAALALFRRKRRSPLPPGGTAMAAALVLLTLNLLHPQTQPASGIAQLVFQAAIISPVFWASPLVDGERRLRRVLWILFACNLMGTLAGILQIYFPDQFLPAEFSNGASTAWLRSLTFVNPAGRTLVRPPGLSDLPGGAAISGSLTALLGIGLSSRRFTPIWLRFASLAAAAAGAAVLYLTQVRSLTAMTLVGLFLMTALAFRQPRLWNRAWIAGAAICLVVGSFCWATTIGGDRIRDRLFQIDAQSYGNVRGSFWRYTFGEGLELYPLGAGLGRWGMMGVYFGDPERPDSPPLWAEIQITGWLYDGGVPLWLLYGAGICASMLFLFRVALSPCYGTVVPVAATIAFCVNCNIVGASFSGPSFNTTMGLQYWLLVALVYGAARKSWRRSEPARVRWRLSLPQTASA